MAKLNATKYVVPANELLQDRAIRHAVYLQGYTNKQVKETLTFLHKQVLPDAIDKLESKLKTIDLTTSVSAQKQRDVIASVSGIISGGLDSAGDALKKEMKEFAISEAEWQAKVLQDATKGLEVSWNMPSKQLLDSVLNIPVNGAHMFKDELRGQVESWWSGLNKWQVNETAKNLRIGLAEGESMQKLINRVMGTKSAGYKDGVLGKLDNHVKTQVRTYVNHVSNEAREAVLDENTDVIKEVQYIATLDARTSVICASLDEQTFPIGQGPRPPMHFNCRSTTAPVLKSWKELGIPLNEAPDGTRASMNGQVPEKMTYSKWLKKQPTDIQNQVLGPTRAKMFRAGTPIDKFVNNKYNVLTLDELRQLEGLAVKPKPKPAPKPKPKPKPEPKPAAEPKPAPKVKEKAVKYSKVMSEADAEKWAAQGGVKEPLYLDPAAQGDDLFTKGAKLVENQDDYKSLEMSFKRTDMGKDAVTAYVNIPEHQILDTGMDFYKGYDESLDAHRVYKIYLKEFNVTDLNSEQAMELLMDADPAELVKITKSLGYKAVRFSDHGKPWMLDILDDGDDLVTLVKTETGAKKPAAAVKAVKPAPKAAKTGQAVNMWADVDDPVVQKIMIEDLESMAKTPDKHGISLAKNQTMDSLQLTKPAGMTEKQAEVVLQKAYGITEKEIKDFGVKDSLDWRRREIREQLKKTISNTGVNNYPQEAYYFGFSEDAGEWVVQAKDVTDKWVKLPQWEKYRIIKEIEGELGKQIPDDELFRLMQLTSDDAILVNKPKGVGADAFDLEASPTKPPAKAGEHHMGPLTVDEMMAVEDDIDTAIEEAAELLQIQYRERTGKNLHINDAKEVVDSVRKYTHGHDQMIRQYLQDKDGVIKTFTQGEFDTRKMSRAQVKKLVDDIDFYFKYSDTPPPGTPAYRGLGFDLNDPKLKPEVREFIENVKRAKPGSRLYDDSFSSWSFDEDVAMDFAGYNTGMGQDGTLQVIMVTDDGVQGRRIGHFSEHAMENELLMGRNSEFEVIDVDWHGEFDPTSSNRVTIYVSRVERQ